MSPAPAAHLERIAPVAPEVVPRWLVDDYRRILEELPLREKAEADALRDARRQLNEAVNERYRRMHPDAPRARDE